MSRHPERHLTRSMEFKYPDGGEWVAKTYGVMCDEWGEAAAKERIEWYYRDYFRAKLRYFLPHGIPWSDKERVIAGGQIVIPPSCYPREMKNDGVAMLSDQTTDIVMLVAPNKTGKTYHAAAWNLLGCIPCDPKWELFTKHGVTYHEWTGPKIVRIFSFAWENIADLWEIYRELIPRNEFPDGFAPDWGAENGECGKARNLQFRNYREKSIRLKCETQLVMGSYRQSDSASEGYKAHRGHFDEQSDQKTWFGFLRGSTTMGDFTPSIHSFSGRIIKGREADTGESGWIKTQLYDGANTYGKTISRYHFNVKDTPDAIVTKAKKEELFARMNNPRRTEHERLADIARLEGGFEPGGGLVLDNFRKHIHILPEYDRSYPLVIDATKGRAIDHGLGMPCAGLLSETFPWGDTVIFAEYFVAGSNIPVNAAKIVEMCGNTRERGEDYEDQQTQFSIPTFTEQMVNMDFHNGFSVIDGRSFAMPGGMTSHTVGELYNACGLHCTPACTKYDRSQIPNMHTYFRSDPDRPHIMWQFQRVGIITKEQYAAWLKSRDGDWKGGARAYVTCNCVRLIASILSWVMIDGKPSSKDAHLTDAMKYLFSEDPVYSGQYWKSMPESCDTDYTIRRPQFDDVETDERGGRFVTY